MPKPKSTILFQIPENEKEILRKYCEQEQRTQSDVLRELVRALKKNDPSIKLDIEIIKMKESYWVEYASLNSRNQIVSYGYAEVKFTVSENGMISAAEILLIKSALLEGVNKMFNDSVDPVVAITIHSWLPLKVR